MKLIVACPALSPDNKTLANPLLENKPQILFKPDSALQKTGKPFFIPDFSCDLKCSFALLFRVCRLGKSISRRFAGRYYDAVSVGLDLYASGSIYEGLEKGLADSLLYSFDGSAIVGDFVGLEEQAKQKKEITSRFIVDGDDVRTFSLADLPFSPEDVIEHVSQFCTMKMGDLIFIRLRAEALNLSIGQHIEGFVGEDKVLDCVFK